MLTLDVSFVLCTSAQKNRLPKIPECPKYEKFFQERFRDFASLKGKNSFRLHLDQISLVQYKIVKHKQYSCFMMIFDFFLIKSWQI